jgi:hypothetical protein
MAEELKQRVKESWLRQEGRLEGMSFDEKRQLLLHLFNGKDREGKKYGVYVEKKNDRWVYTLNGAFSELVGIIDKKIK